MSPAYDGGVKEKPRRSQGLPSLEPERPRTVAELMRRQFVTVAPDASLLEAHQIMRLARLRHLPVARDGMLVGVLSYRDVQEEILDQLGPEGTKTYEELLASIAVNQAMIPFPWTVTPETDLAEAATRLYRLRVGCLPVAEPSEEGPRLVGLITESDLLRAAYDPLLRWSAAGPPEGAPSG